MSATDNFPPLMSPATTADYAGVSEWTIRRWINEGLLPYARPSGKQGGRILIARKDIDAFLTAATVPATAGPLADRTAL